MPFSPLGGEGGGWGARSRLPRGFLEMARPHCGHEGAADPMVHPPRADSKLPQILPAFYRKHIVAAADKQYNIRIHYYNAAVLSPVRRNRNTGGDML